MSASQKPVIRGVPNRVTLQRYNPSQPGVVDLSGSSATELFRDSNYEIAPMLKGIYRLPPTGGKQAAKDRLRRQLIRTLSTIIDGVAALNPIHLEAAGHIRSKIKWPRFRSPMARSTHG